MAKGTVLVVDDDQVISDLVAEALEMQGYMVLQAVGKASLPLADCMQPGVILLDINMPGMNGIEVSQQMRDNPATTHIPIIIMSADHQRRAASNLVADAWLAKPFHLTELYAVVNRWIPTV